LQYSRTCLSLTRERKLSAQRISVSGFTGCWIVPSGLASCAPLGSVDLRQQSPDIRLCHPASIGIRATTNIVAQFLLRLKSLVSLRRFYE
jgi:hypothetical protein